MNDSVKFIFKTLVKVPIIILVSYLIFNLFAFSFTYFRLVGLSYVVMQTAVENNFIPEQEKNTLTAYAHSLETGVVSNVHIGCDTDNSNDAGLAGNDDTSDTGYYLNIEAANCDNNKVQYGTPITVSVSAKYTWIFPLIKTSSVGYNNQYAADFDPNSNGVIWTEDENANTEHNILISYTVPGLKYYPDLS